MVLKVILCFVRVFADGRMEAELGADSARRKMEAAGEALEIVPLEMYDSARAKIAANLRWLFAKAFGIGKFLMNDASQMC